MVFDSIPALQILFEIVFPIVLLALLIITIITCIPNRRKNLSFMTYDEFLKEWLLDHGQQHRMEEVLQDMKKNPVGGFYQPITYKGGKLFAKWGFTPNKVSFINLILTLLAFYLTIMAGEGHNLDIYTQQPFYGALIFAAGGLLLLSGIIDGIDGSIARLLDKQTKTGAWLDANIDRICDVLMFVCLVPGGYIAISQYNLDFTWLVWTNIFLIFIYEYMRAKHHEVGLNQSQPFFGERPTRIIILSAQFLTYGISSFSVMITYLIDPTSTLWHFSHTGIAIWSMLIYQVILFIIIGMSTIRSALWIWKKLKEMDSKNENKKEVK
ncbi:MAG: CDP-alcohol phosphatidyltransferase family protein [Promethearchaeota archaeon]|nr:MAG: CDP-alcohol phosphatidyltransferase family protein [Candidatus Lokiarchaeota archaeon]